MKKNLVIFGNSPLAQLAKFYFDTDSNYQVVAFTVDEAYIQSDTFEGLPLLEFETIKDQFPIKENDFFVAVSYHSMNKLRMKKYNRAKEMGYTIASYISSKCSYLSQYPPGENAFILEDNTVQPFVRIGNNVTLWSGNHLGHHSIIEDHNFISSHVVISGHCTIESFCFLGVNATIGHQVTIAEKTLVGAGAVITKSTEAESVYVPAKSVKLNVKSSEITL